MKVSPKYWLQCINPLTCRFSSIMAAASSVNFGRLVHNQACIAAENFVKLFYATLDKKRHLVSNLYLDTAHLIWNGNSYSGKENIAKFFESIPESVSEFRSVDAQPVVDQVVAGQTSIMVSVSGHMQFSKKTHLFSETFILTSQPGAQGNVWKILSECLRFHEP